MIWNLITGLLPDVWPYIAGAAVIVAGWFTARRSGVKAQKARQAEATVKGVQAGAKGAAKAEAALRAGKTPEDIVRGNDHDWR